VNRTKRTHARNRNIKRSRSFQFWQYLAIYSEVAEGTTVKIYLPRHYGEEDLVLAAASGAAALEPIGRGHDIDILFTAIVMPGGTNGRQLADESVHQRPALKVLFITGYTVNAVVHHEQLDPTSN
jgi:CheY-like chemotaxis protein